MMRRFFRFLSVFLAIFCLFLFASCNSNNENTLPSKAEGTSSPSANVLDQEVALSGIQDRKIVRTASLTAQTKEYDAAISAIRQQVTDAGGYISDSSERGNADEQQERSLFMTIRIPSEKLDTFLSGAQKSLHVTYASVSSEDISTIYYDTESRLKTLRAEKDALDTMLSNATTTSDILAIHQRLYDVMEEIDRYETNMNLYRDQISYATVKLNVEEVGVYSPQTESFGCRIQNAFKESWEDFASFWASALVSLVYVIPFLLIVGVIVAVIMVLANVEHRKKKSRRNAGNSNPK